MICIFKPFTISDDKTLSHFIAAFSYAFILGRRNSYITQVLAVMAMDKRY
jgi:hypothetical protein